MGNISPRETARAAGLKRYLTGEACPAGHNGPRFVSNGRCCECARLAHAKQRKNSPEHVHARDARSRVRNAANRQAMRKAYYVKNTVREKQAAVKWQQANSERVRAMDRKRYHANIEQKRATARAYAKMHRVEALARYMKYRASKLRATPNWSDAGAVLDFYKTAHGLGMLTGEWYHVDHIVPVQSPRMQSLAGNTLRKKDFIGPLLPIVQGLHVPANLQVLVGAENISKGNRNWPDMPKYKG